MSTDIEEIVNIEEVTDNKLKEPKKYKVLVYNDDFTTIEFVISLLMTIFKHSQNSAVELTKRVHNEGKAIAGIYSYEIAEQKVLDATDISRANNYPLVIRALPE
jgi:ATP-dependent Clp protease adaptor protein ClpS